MMKKKVVIVLAALIVVGGVTVGSIAMNGNSDKKHIDKKTKIVLETDQENKDSKDNEDSQEQTEESNTEESNVSEEQKEESVATSSSEEKKETKKESKKEEKEKSKKTEEKKSTKEEKKTFSTEASKPSSKPVPSKPAPSKPNKPSHTHNWVATTKQVHHPAVGHNEKVLVKAAWTEKIPRYTQVAREICNTCGADITGNTSKHLKEHALKGENASRRTEYKKVFSHYEEVYHEAQYTTKWVIDKAAWTETVVTGYHCSCGAKK